MPKVIITGAGGFVGTNLSAFLEKNGYHVFPLSLRDPQWKTKMPQDADVLIHLAGLAHDLKGTRKPEDYFRVNTDLTKELFDGFLESRISTFIFFSSVKAVAGKLGSTVLYESRAPETDSPYGESKLKAEHYLLSGNFESKKIYVLRPSMIHGPGNKGNLNLLYKLVASGLPYPLAAFENARSFLSIDNLNVMVRELCHGKAPAGIYNLADSEYLSTLEVVRIINLVLGKKPKIWRISPVLVRALARISGLLRLPFDWEKLEKLTESYKVSNEKIRAVLGCDLPVTANEGLSRTIQSFKDR